MHGQLKHPSSFGVHVGVEAGFVLEGLEIATTLLRVCECLEGAIESSESSEHQLSSFPPSSSWAALDPRLLAVTQTNQPLLDA